MRLFQFVSIEAPSTFTRNETFCEHRGLLRVFGTVKLSEKRNPIFPKSGFKATSEARCLIVSVGFFFAKTGHPSALVKVSAIFLQAYFSETIQNFKNKTATECPFWPCKKVPKIFRLVDFIASKTRFLRKFLGFFPNLSNFTT